MSFLEHLKTSCLLRSSRQKSSCDTPTEHSDGVPVPCETLFTLRRRTPQIRQQNLTRMQQYPDILARGSATNQP
eukprot:4260151-Pyramimonas_sp.AAC.1